jgi:hypothetical protein
MQSNQDIIKLDNEDSIINIIDNDIWENIIEMIQNKQHIESLKDYIHKISISYNIDKKNIIKDFLNYIIRNHPKYINKDFLHFVENLMHSQIQNNNTHIYYALSRLSSLLLSK